METTIGLMRKNQTIALYEAIVLSCKVLGQYENEKVSILKFDFKL